MSYPSGELQVVQDASGKKSQSIPVTITGGTGVSIGTVSVSTDAQANAAAPAATEGQQVPLSLDLARNLRVISQQAGGVGADFSFNKPTLPNVGANFGSTGPYANYVLVGTIAASASRQNIDVENTSGAQIAIVRDDGTAANGAAPANASVFALGGGSAVGAQGGAWSSTTFKGRLQIYAPVSTAFVTTFGE